MSFNVAEEWRPVKGYEGIYEVSNLGRVKSLKRTIINQNRKVQVKERILKPSIQGQGYYGVGLSRDGIVTTFRVARLVAYAFLPTCPGVHGSKKGEYQIDHINNNKLDNRACNLQWLLGKDNCFKGNCIEYRTPLRGKQLKHTKLSEEEVIKIRNDYRTVQEIADEYEVDRITIQDILSGRNWKHVPYPNKEEQRRFRKNKRAKGSMHACAKILEEDVIKIRKDTRDRETIAKEYNLTPGSIWKIQNRYTWKHVPD